jgi:hypothetical protein
MFKEDIKNGGVYFILLFVCSPNQLYILVPLCRQYKKQLEVDGTYYGHVWKITLMTLSTPYQL